MQINKINEQIALRIHKEIKAQVLWLKEQDDRILHAIVNNRGNLRQLVQARHSGFVALQAIKDLLVEYTGFRYEDLVFDEESNTIDIKKDNLPY